MSAHNNLKVSIIVPVYNGERYLRECIQSICEQTYRNFELILIDDGSNDGSLRICEEFSKMDSRILVISKMNTGVSDTRNCGLELASGEYVTFVDCDDYLSRDFIKDGMREVYINKAEIVICGYQTFSLSGGMAEQVPLCCFLGDNESFISKCFVDLLTKSILYTQCSKLISMGIIKTHNIRFDERFSICEDAMFSIDVLSKCNLICVMNSSYYNYRQDTIHSLSKRYYPNSFEGNFLLYEKVSKYLQNHKSDRSILKDTNRIFLARVIYFIIMLYYASGVPSKLCYEKLIGLYRNNTFLHILNYPTDKTRGRERVIIYLLQHKRIVALHILMILKYRYIRGRSKV